jgi:hypothetical protein
MLSTVLIWVNIASFSEGQRDNPTLKVISPSKGRDVSLSTNTLSISNPTDGNQTNNRTITTGAHNNSKANSTTLNTIKEDINTSGNVSANLRQSTSSFAYTSNYNNNNSKPISISIKSSQNIVNGKGRSNVTATAYDSITGKKLDNATIKLRITFPSNSTSKEIVSHNGQATYNTELNQNSKNNNYNATVAASAPGYISTTDTTTSSSTSITTSNSK